MDFSKITKQHILEAIKLYEEKGSPSVFGPSTSYDLIHDGKSYPPKVIAAYAANISTGEPIVNDFYGGPKQACFKALEKADFEITSKKDGITFFTQEDFETIEKYAKVRRVTGNKEHDEAIKILKKSYDKVKYWQDEVQKKVFANGKTQIRRNPINQGQVFERYQWGKIYPSEKSPVELAFTVGFADDEELHVKIDTVGLADNDPRRVKYFEYRGDWNNSPIVRHFTRADTLTKDWDYLIEESVKYINQIKVHYNRVAQIMGLNTDDTNMESKQNSGAVELLKFKHQIILQGPPGTGKTRLAKQLAGELIGSSDFELTPEHISENLIIGQTINGASDQPDYYTVESKNNINVVLSSMYTKSGGHSAKYMRIIDYFNRLKQGEILKASRSHESYDLAVAKYFYNQISTGGKLEIVQFHPSYTYEDFVRGISAKGGQNGVEYVTENRILGRLANEALQNFRDSQKEEEEVSRDQWLADQFELFKDSLQMKLDNEQTISLTNAVKLVRVGLNYFKYEGGSWHDYLKYSLFIEMYKEGILDTAGIRKRFNTDTRSTYYAAALELFRKFIGNKKPPTEEGKRVKLKNYVLIIDEINRANLSSVLGELIYALEYRGEEVQSLYEIEDEGNGLIIPSNLYIIGTMNTADRSVGQIDYAIRRRFAFVDVLPAALDVNELNKNREEGDPELFFATELFYAVERLFVREKGSNERSEHLLEEFEPKDVQIGHSYYIHTSDNLNMRLEYEIKPILREYVKDGILKASASEIIDNLKA